MKFNPFRPGNIVVPGMFAGRSEEIKAIEQALFQTKNRNPHHFLIHGERGIGKSSLFMYLEYIALGEFDVDEKTRFNFITINIELDPNDTYLGIINKIGSELRRSITKEQKVKEVAKKAWDFLSRWEFGGIKYNKTEEINTQEVLEELVYAIESTTSQLPEKDGILILIDEADKAPATANLGGFVKLFTERLAKRHCDNVALGISGISTLLQTLQQTHESSLRTFQIFRLDPLSIKERKLVIDLGLKNANEKNEEKTTINEDAKEWISRYSEGYPQFIQQFAYSAFEQDNDNIINVEDVHLGAFKENGAFHQLGQKYFQNIYFEKINSDEYRKVLNTMSEEMDGWVSKRELKDKTNLKETVLNHAIEALKERGIIIAKPGTKGVYKLPTKAFAVWIDGYSKGDKNL